MLMILQEFHKYNFNDCCLNIQKEEEGTKEYRTAFNS